jgi:hypothetical protein
LIEDTPTSKSQGVFIGLTELKGSAESEKPFTGFLSGSSNILYNWTIEEHWQRTVTETYHDAQGHAHTRTRIESGWSQVAEGGESAPFYLKDDSGLIRINPQGAKIQSKQTYNQTFKRDNLVYFAKGPQREIANSTHQRRFIEYALPLHIELYVMGQARQRDDAVAAEIAQDKSCPLFLISTSSEKKISGGYNAWFWAFLLIGLLLSSGAAVWWEFGQSADRSFEVWVPLLAAAVYLLLFGLLWMWAAFNSLINLHHRVEQAWSQVDIQLKRRQDLIPNLVKSVQGFQSYEKGTQTLLAEMRRQIEATPPGSAGVDYRGLAPLLRIIVESYPDLKADTVFLELQKALVEAEQRIALARDYFNDTATFFNTRLEIIPERYIASLAGLKPAFLMGAAEFERAPIKVRLVE